jgi:predicted nucleic acid-binding protein
VTNVKFADALSGVRRLFLDTAPMIYYVEGNQRYLPRLEPIFESFDAGTVRAVTSPVTLSECLVLPYRLQDAALQRLFVRQIVDQSLFVPVDQPVAQIAAQLRSEHNLNLLDAFQLAVAQASQCEAFLTNDLALKRVAGLRIIVLDELERPETAA